MVDLRKLTDHGELAQYLVDNASRPPLDIIAEVKASLQSGEFGDPDEPMEDDICPVACIITGLAALVLALSTESEALAESNLGIAYEALAHAAAHGHPLASAVIASCVEGEPVYSAYLAATDWAFDNAAILPMADIPEYVPAWL